ncbi:MAG: glycosyltransferase [Dissulfurispiraceae bacterium]
MVYGFHVQRRPGCYRETMRVLMISKALVVGAYHKKLEEIAKLGVDLHLVVPQSWGHQKLEIRKGNGYTISPLRLFFNGKNHFHFYIDLGNTIKKIKPDIVYIDEEHYSIVTFQAMRLAKQANARVLFFTWQNIYKRYPFPFSSIQKYVFKNADSAIAGNEEAKDTLKRKGFDKNITVIPQFGVDPDIFKKITFSDTRSDIGLVADKFIVGFMGRLVEEKGVLDLIRAVARVKGRENLLLLLIGSGPLGKKIIDLAAREELGQNIKLIDQVPSMDVPLYMNCFDCLVLPSRTRPNWKEQFGRVLIEAMACEIPVIGSSSGEIPNVIADAGMVFQEGDIDDLAKRIELLLDDKELRASLGKKGRERVLDWYTQKKIAVDTYRIYEDLMSKQASV